MATSVTQSLFGITPESIMQERSAAANRQAMDFARLDPFEAARYGLFRGASQLGEGLTSAMGYEDPEIARAKARQGMLSGVDLNNPESLLAKAQSLQATDPMAAQALVAQANERQVTLTAKQEADNKKAEEKRRLASLAQVVQQKTGLSPEESLALAQDPATVRKLMEEPEAKYVTENVNGRVHVYKSSPNGFEFVKDLGAAPDKSMRVINNLPKTSGDIIGFRKELNAVVKPFRDAVNAADQAIVLADNAMQTGNFAAASSLARSLAKASGEEQLSREDVRAFGGDPSLVGSVSDAVSRLATGTVTNDTLRQLKSLAVILKNKNAGLERQELEKMQNLARASGNYSEAEINEVFDNRVRTPRREPGKGQTRTTKSGVKYTVED